MDVLLRDVLLRDVNGGARLTVVNGAGLSSILGTGSLTMEPLLALRWFGGSIAQVVSLKFH